MTQTFLREFFWFGVRQAQACLFGAYLLVLVLVTRLWYPLDGILYRNDFLFLAAIGFQTALLAFKLETWREASVIFVFHVVATGLEVFKTSSAIGAWQYPGEFVFGIGNVPLFAGFMYSAVGSYIARVWRIFDFCFTGYPPISATVALVTLVYVNFFTHHFIVDLRAGLLIAMLLLFGRTWVHYRPVQVHRRMPLVVGWFLVALFIWFAENIATYAGIWLYPHQQSTWQLVSPAKLVAWNLLMLLSFVLVTLIHKPRVPDPSAPRSINPDQATADLPVTANIPPQEWAHQHRTPHEHGRGAVRTSVEPI
jgi:uncharacterized membrane protein YoaT (DUF817 family)